MTNSAIHPIHNDPHAFGCASDTMDAARLPGDTIASVWRCIDCEKEVPFTEADFEFCNSWPWRAPGKQRIFPRR